MDKKEMLTTEPISRRFKNPFALVNYAIKLGENMIKTGRGSYIRTDVQNVSHQILLEILNGKDAFQELPKPREEIVRVEVRTERVEAPVKERERERDRDREKDKEKPKAKKKSVRLEVEE